MFQVTVPTVATLPAKFVQRSNCGQKYIPVFGAAAGFASNDNQLESFGSRGEIDAQSSCFPPFSDKVCILASG